MSGYSDKFIPEPNSGCWIWLGQINQFGYGRTRLPDGRTQVAHRAVYEDFFCTKVPDELQLDHLCRLRCCVNPDHLEPVTRLENVRRAFRANNKAQKEDCCINGHSWSSANITMQKTKTGWRRICRPCKLQSRAKYRANLKSRKLAA